MTKDDKIKLNKTEQTEKFDLKILRREGIDDQDGRLMAWIL